MGVRIGTRVGPVSVSTRVRSRDLADGARGLGYLWGLAILVLLLVTAAPIVPAALGVWMLLSRPILAKVFGLAFVAGAVVFAIWLWPREWVYVFRSDDLPDVAATSVPAAKQQLAAAGFTHVTIADGSPRTLRAGTVRVPLTSSACFVESTSPAPGDRTD